MAQIGSFVLLLALVLSGYCFVAGIVALVRGGRTRNESEKPPDARDRDLPAPISSPFCGRGRKARCFSGRSCWQPNVGTGVRLFIRLHQLPRVLSITCSHFRDHRDGWRFARIQAWLVKMPATYSSISVGSGLQEACLTSTCNFRENAQQSTLPLSPANFPSAWKK